MSINVIEKAVDNLAVLSLDSKLLQNNIISISGEITQNMAEEFQNQIMYLVCNSKNKKIQILINSYGGSVYAGLSMIDMIEYAKKKGFEVEIVCTGVAMSMASIILLNGSKRYCMKNSTIMFHEGSTILGGKNSVMKNQMKEFDRIEKILDDMVESKSKLKAKDYIGKDFYCDAKKAKELNVVDDIK